MLKKCLIQTLAIQAQSAVHLKFFLYKHIDINEILSRILNTYM